MARLYSQLATVVFLVLGIGGLFLGTAAASNPGGGNFEGVILHLTWVRDAVDIGLGLAFLFVGFVASRHLGRIVCAAAGVLLLALTALGFVVGDNDAATQGALGMHFPTFINAFDLAAGFFAVLAALGTLEDEPEPVLQRHA